MALQYKKGVCSECDEEKMIVKPSKKLCYSCNQKRLESVKPKKVGKPIRKTKKTGELALFESIWETRAKVSYLSGRDLSKTPNYLILNCFAHVLPKGKYPKFRLSSENIVLLHHDEHYLLDFGTEDQRKKYAQEHNCSWASLYKLRDRLKKEYDKL